MKGRKEERSKELVKGGRREKQVRRTDIRFGGNDRGVGKSERKNTMEARELK